VIRLLRRVSDNRRIETVVEGRGICASMCVPVYLQGEVRRASANARFMFHEVSFRESFSDDKIDVPEKAIGNATDRFFSRYFAPAGVPEEWIRQVRRDVTGGADVWKSAQELIDENAGIVQRID
jgi:ATP-dependent protease ClpP protease subunit